MLRLLLIRVDGSLAPGRRIAPSSSDSPLETPSLKVVQRLGKDTSPAGEGEGGETSSFSSESSMSMPKGFLFDLSIVAALLLGSCTFCRGDTALLLLFCDPSVLARTCLAPSGPAMPWRYSKELSVSSSSRSGRPSLAKADRECRGAFLRMPLLSIGRGAKGPKAFDRGIPFFFASVAG